MKEQTPVSKKSFSADWFLRGALTRIGDSFDRLTGRKWVPSSSLATSELIERIKKLLDAEAIDVAGKGRVVPHLIKLKVQWNKFSDNAPEALETLETELLAAAVDHINDSLYYTYAPLSLEVKPDYFVEGVKLYVSFDKFRAGDEDVELNVTVPSIDLSKAVADITVKSNAAVDTYLARFSINGLQKETRLEFPPTQRRSVGRTAANDLVLDDPSVSKIHASLGADENGVLAVADTGSTNGTFINGERMAYAKAVQLQGENKVKFGEIEVTFEHLPRPVLEPVPPGTGQTEEDTVMIGGMEFKTRDSTRMPVFTAADKPNLTASDGLDLHKTSRIGPKSKTSDPDKASPENEKK